MIKAFTAFTPNYNLKEYLKSELLITDDFRQLLDLTEERQITPPTAGQWQSVGFTKVCDEWVQDCPHDVTLFVVAIADRVLPGSVLRTALAAEVAKVEAKEHRKLGKKEIMQIKDDIVPSMLDKSHIKVTHVPVMLSSELCIVGSASIRVVDSVVALLNSLLCELLPDARVVSMNFEKLPAMLDLILNEPTQYDFVELGEKLTLSTETGTVKFTETELYSDAVAQHLVGSWSVNAIQLHYGSTTLDGHFVPKFTVDVLPAGLFRGFKLSGLLDTDIKSHLGESNDDAESVRTTAWMTHAELVKFIAHLTCNTDEL